ncbi:peptide ABC transporter permease [Candidatus Magnetobacterium bavaricum]|uniref:Peptide ABC transporter permease n=1 Tax=Candidatus Magnetobacterium bavaricum TaxID=29290 RepID=A0A0F3GLK5_9BACT|nr:peptide ABC transporter permease [Candidatus Magnetobacterium bavaricum]
MAKYIIKRVLVLVAIVLGITFLVFSLIKALPGDPVVGLLGQRADPEDIKRIGNALGVDKPFLVQYTGFVTLLLRGDLGRSYYSNRDVIREIAHKLPNTIALATAAMTLGLVFGLVFGFVAGVNNGGYIDRVFSVLSLAGLSVPVFWSGLMLMVLLSLKLELLPPSGTAGMRYVILPAITLSLPASATIARVVRASVIDTLRQPFVRFLTAKGLTRRRILGVHVLKNILIPLITIVGLDFGSFLNGSVLTETIFGWDGIGRYTVEGIFKRDYPVVMGCILTGSAVFVLINTLVDIAYHYVDPRLRSSTPQ